MTALPMTANGRNGQVHFDGHTVTITREGFVARTTRGRSDKQLPLTGVSAVQFKPASALVYGFIQFTIAGGNERTSRLGRQARDAADDENSVTFTKAQMPAFQAMRDALNAAMTGSHAAAPTHTGELPAQLAQLTDLHRTGALSDDEFAAAKARMLAR